VQVKEQKKHQEQEPEQTQAYKQLDYRSTQRLSAPVLTSREASVKVKGKVYMACIQTILGYVNETWALKVMDMPRLERIEMMVRWMRGANLKISTARAELNSRLGIECITDVVRRIITRRC